MTLPFNCTSFSITTARVSGGRLRIRAQHHQFVHRDLPRHASQVTGSSAWLSRRVPRASRHLVDHLRQRKRVLLAVRKRDQAVGRLRFQNLAHHHIRQRARGRKMVEGITGRDVELFRMPWSNAAAAELAPPRRSGRSSVAPAAIPESLILRLNRRHQRPRICR